MPDVQIENYDEPDDFTAVSFNRDSLLTAWKRGYEGKPVKRCNVDVKPENTDNYTSLGKILFDEDEGDDWDEASRQVGLVMLWFLEQRELERARFRIRTYFHGTDPAEKVQWQKVVERTQPSAVAAYGGQEIPFDGGSYSTPADDPSVLTRTLEAMTQMVEFSTTTMTELMGATMRREEAMHDRMLRTLQNTDRAHDVQADVIERMVQANQEQRLELAAYRARELDQRALEMEAQGRARTRELLLSGPIGGTLATAFGLAVAGGVKRITGLDVSKVVENLGSMMGRKQETPQAGSGVALLGEDEARYVQTVEFLIGDLETNENLDVDLRGRLPPIKAACETKDVAKVAALVTQLGESLGDPFSLMSVVGTDTAQTLLQIYNLSQAMTSK